MRVVEKETNPRIGQRGAGIMPRSPELFQFLGVVDVITKAGIPVPTIRMYKPDGVEF